MNTETATSPDEEVPEAAPETGPWIPADTFGLRLSAVRQVMGWNITQAAQACGLSAQSWWNWERGGSCRDVLAVVTAIAKATGVDRNWLAWGPDDGGEVLDQLRRSLTFRRDPDVSAAMSDVRTGYGDHRRAG